MQCKIRFTNRFDLRKHKNTGADVKYIDAEISEEMNADAPKVGSRKLYI